MPSMMVHPAGFDMITMPCIALAEVEVVHHGRAAHASAMPFRGLNALDALVTAYQSLAQLRQHIQQTERIHGIIVEGGLAPNIVPERAAGRFYVRARDGVELAALKNAFKPASKLARSRPARASKRPGARSTASTSNQLALRQSLRSQRPRARPARSHGSSRTSAAGHGRARPTWATSAIVSPRSIP